MSGYGALEKALELPESPVARQCGTVDGMVGLAKIDEAGVSWGIEFCGVTNDLSEVKS
jgi:hypothetical protein